MSKIGLGIVLAHKKEDIPYFKIQKRNANSPICQITIDLPSDSHKEFIDALEGVMLSEYEDDLEYIKQLKLQQKEITKLINERMVEVRNRFADTVNNNIGEIRDDFAEYFI